jgi:hypothetical protein
MGATQDVHLVMRHEDSDLHLAEDQNYGKEARAGVEFKGIKSF